MTEFLHMILLAVIQGLTEFLPVSSSGHLVLTQALLGIGHGDLFLEVALHVGTLGSILAVYRREVGRLLKLDAPARAYVAMLVVGTLPLGVIGILFRSAVESLFDSAMFAAFGLIFTSALLFSTLRRSTMAGEVKEWEPVAPRPLPALLVGVAQAFAIMPGISRSGATIAAGMWVGLPRAEAARFSFLLAVPAIAGAMVLQIMGDGLASRGDFVPLLAAVAVAFAVGLLAIRWTALAVVQAHFWKFGFYCLALGVCVLAFLVF